MIGFKTRTNFTHTDIIQLGLAVLATIVLLNIIYSNYIVTNKYWYDTMEIVNDSTAVVDKYTIIAYELRNDYKFVVMQDNRKIMTTFQSSHLDLRSMMNAIQAFVKPREFNKSPPFEIETPFGVYQRATVTFSDNLSVILISS